MPKAIIYLVLILSDFSLVGPSASHAGVAFLAIMALLVASTIAWFGYAYFFPHSWSGRLLIKVRKNGQKELKANFLC